MTIIKYFLFFLVTFDAFKFNRFKDFNELHSENREDIFIADEVINPSKIIDFNSLHFAYIPSMSSTFVAINLIKSMEIMEE